MRLAWMLCSLSLLGCATSTPEALHTDDSALCTPETQVCWAVTEGFVLGRLLAEEQLVKARAELARCRAK
jgi:hypothetical protein